MERVIGFGLGVVGMGMVCGVVGGGVGWWLLRRLSAVEGERDELISVVTHQGIALNSRTQVVDEGEMDDLTGG